MPKINRRPQITEKAEGTEKISSLHRLNWLEAASNNAVGYATKYKDDPYKLQATIELRDIGYLMLQIMHSEDGKGAQRLGAAFVKARAEQIRQHEARNPVERPNRHDWTPTNEESEPPF
ncbi:hypothetical protein SEA_MAKOTO_34 [Arthrobacter phage Makoto]|uniref:Uncharacterized protein n=3 Tax=Korravirus drrobert TaxID=1982078 RepID=A0A6B9LBZ2_9CAUD|nr:hypothetical protein SEA_CRISTINAYANG_34 [Arthrobacter phage CristinaYang]AZS09501.1 hypothetical protein SEA_PTERODACTYL_34 [Arthrobacter phage Pterodactyl]QHB36868.1 hypothetical protein SEA_LILSTUART_34 [Arthrobacter phage LilStuart]WNM67611.1 hypothetical protein SEA_MAKOTO_34 [Arthrobacter phage Makoto]